MEHRLPATGNAAGKDTGKAAEKAADPVLANPDRSSVAGTPSRARRSPVRLILTVLAGLLAVAGVASLGALLWEALQGGPVWPGFAGGAFYALPAAFLLMAGLVIDSILHRRRG